MSIHASLLPLFSLDIANKLIERLNELLDCLIVTPCWNLTLQCFLLLCINCRECEVISQADEDDTIYRVATPSISKGSKGQDFILLASRRKPCDSRCCNIYIY